jgi:hypothetical protein
MEQVDDEGKVDSCAGAERRTGAGGAVNVDVQRPRCVELKFTR